MFEILDMSQLNRDDIVGKRIARVLRTPGLVDGMFSGCSVFVSLESGVTFELVAQGVDPPQSVTAVDPATLKLVPAVFPPEVRNCIGEQVIEVLVSDYWPTIGILLESGRFLLNSDNYSPMNVQPCLTPVGEFYDMQDARPYWDQEHAAKDGGVA